MLVPIENVGSVGIISDLEAHDMPPEAWSDARNVRFEERGAVRSNGDEQVFGALSTEPYGLLPWQDVSAYYWFYMSATKAYRTDGTLHVDVTPTAGNFAAGSYPRWNGGVLGGVPIINNTGGTDTPHSWDSGTTKFLALANWPAGYTCKVIRPFLQYLVALDITQSGTRYPTKILWSHPADPGAIPSSWDVTDATKDAGEYPLSETDGFLVDCLPLGSVNFVYKADSIWTMQFIGGQFIFKFDRAFRSASVGLLTYGAVQEFNKRHFFVTNDDVMVHNGNTVESVIHARMRRWLFNTIDDSAIEKVEVVSLSKEHEMWVLIPTSGGSGYADLAAIWNWDTGRWTIRELDSVAVAHTGVVNETEDTTFDGQSVLAFDSDVGAFNETSFSAVQNEILFGSQGSTDMLMKANVGSLIGGRGYTSSLIRERLAVVGRDRQGRWKIDVGSVKFLRGIFLKVVCEVEITITVAVVARMRLNGPVSGTQVRGFTVGQDEKVDFDLSGRFFDIYISSSESTFWSIQGYTLNLEIISEW